MEENKKDKPEPRDPLEEMYGDDKVTMTQEQWAAHIKGPLFDGLIERLKKAAEEERIVSISQDNPAIKKDGRVFRGEFMEIKIIYRLPERI